MNKTHNLVLELENQIKLSCRSIMFCIHISNILFGLKETLL